MDIIQAVRNFAVPEATQGAVCGYCTKGVSCRVCHVFTALDLPLEHAPNCPVNFIAIEAKKQLDTEEGGENDGDSS